MKTFTRNRTLVLLSVFAGFAMVLAFVFNFLPNYAQEEPPQLPIDDSLLQGNIQIDDGRYFTFTEEEEKDAKASDTYNDANWFEGRVVQYLYADEDMSVEDIIDSIEPDDRTRFVFAYYKADDAVWYTYPEGPYKNTEEIDEDEMDEFIIDAGHAFALVADRDFYALDLKDGAEAPEEMHYRLPQIDEGWSLLAVTNNDDFHQMIAKCSSRIKTLYSQDEQEDFAREDVVNGVLHAPYHLVWFYLDDERMACEPYPVDNGDTPDDNGTDSGEDNDGDDDGSDSGEDCVNEGPFCDLDGIYFADSCTEAAQNATLSPLYLPYAGQCIDLSPGTGNDNFPYQLCNSLDLSPVCDVDGIWYQSACLHTLLEVGSPLSDSYWATDDGRCLDLSDSLPSACNPLEDSPVCDENGVYYPNECYAKFVDDAFVASSDYTANNGVCESIEEDDGGDANVFNGRPVFCGSQVCGTDGVLYEDRCSLPRGVDVSDKYEIVMTTGVARYDISYQCLAIEEEKPEDNPEPTDTAFCDENGVYYAQATEGVEASDDYVLRSHPSRLGTFYFCSAVNTSDNTQEEEQEQIAACGSDGLYYSDSSLMPSDVTASTMYSPVKAFKNGGFVWACATTEKDTSNLSIYNNLVDKLKSSDLKDDQQQMFSTQKDLDVTLNNYSDQVKKTQVGDMNIVIEEDDDEPVNTAN